MSMQTKFLIAGVTRRQGRSTKTGRDYDMAMVQTLQPNDDFGNGLTAAGFKLVEMGTSTEIVTKALGYGFPCECDVKTRLRNDGKLEIIAMQPVAARTAPQTAKAS